MAKQKNPRSIGGGAGEHIGAAFSPSELHAVASAVQAAQATAIEADRITLKRAFAKLRAGSDWQAKHTKSRGV